MNFLKDYQPVRAKLLQDANGKSKGSGFIQMKSSELAQAAIQNLSN